MPRQLDLDRLRRHAEDHAVAWEDLDLRSPIDLGRPFLCETQTPLYYSPLYQRLGDAHKLRYNQLTGMAFNEVISFFETHFAQPLLAGLIAERQRLPAELIEAMQRFAEDERRHTAAFRALNRLSAPSWYDSGEYFILRLRPALLRLLHAFTGRPVWFPAVVWMALIMEEKSLTTSRALLRVGEGRIEPHYYSVYRAHLEDEVRHVQIDWHLLDHLYRPRGRALRWLNARLFGQLLTSLFLAPARAGRRVVGLLVDEFDELQPLRPELLRALDELEHDPAYHRMMYSREAMPIAFGLFDRFPELRFLGDRLLSYEPRAAAASAASHEAPGGPAEGLG